MDVAGERKFIETFINKASQDRLLYELSHIKKRARVLSRFSHSAEDYIKQEYIFSKASKCDADGIALEIAKTTPKANSCYVISDVFDGEFMSIETALHKCFDSGLASIIIFNDNLAFIKTETEYVSATKYILSKAF
ncbi:MAG: hypothetical protein LBS99_05225 [Clostridiales bacterium]|jgi:hypothetical protein|nr:hypothetical protein [Clostridiales bacterium]